MSDVLHSDLASLREELLALELALAERRPADLPGGYSGALDEHFREAGASGRWWTRDAILEELEAAERAVVPIVAFEVELLAPGVALATYETAGARPARRTSVWVLDGDRWRVRYHQGTLVSDVVFREAPSSELGTATIAQLLDLGHACWPDGDFTQDDVEHALGGRHFLAEAGGRLIAHASVVPRLLDVGDRTLRGGYLEAVATLPSRQGQGIATRLVRAADAHLAELYELGALATGRQGFYERLGWRRWRGETWVIEPDGRRVRTPDEDDGIMWLPTATTPPEVRGDEALACRWRPGDVW